VLRNARHQGRIGSRRTPEPVVVDEDDGFACQVAGASCPQRTDNAGSPGLSSLWHAVLMEAVTASSELRSGFEVLLRRSKGLHPLLCAPILIETVATTRS
jgi:hypothetical protein